MSNSFKSVYAQNRKLKMPTIHSYPKKELETKMQSSNLSNIIQKEIQNIQKLQCSCLS